MTELRHDPAGLRLTWPDGLAHVFHPLWLRERSFSPDNKDPATGHRLVEVAFLPLDLAIAHASLDGDALNLAFGDGHRCRYALADLRRCVEQPLPVDLTGSKRFWTAGLAPLPWHDAAALARPDGLLAMLDDLAALGLVLLRGLGTGLDGLQSVTDRIGPIRQTNWGGIADVKSVANPTDLSMTGRALEPHVDNPYRLPAPGYIFLHCLDNSAGGGESIFIDGFHAAARLRRQTPEAWATLTRTEVAFRYADDEAILEHHGPLIELGPDGETHRVRFHNRADQVPAHDPALLSRYYAARRHFAELLWSPEMMLTLKLSPGEGYIVDNFRLLHGRRAIDLATGSRHMRQAYMDRDMVSSRQKVLLRALGRG